MSLVEDFERDMRDGARRCREFGYNPTYWEKMVSDQGAVGAAKQLLKGSRASDGFTRLWEEGRLDLSVEFYILLPKYADLFAREERVEARRRLELHEFDVDRAIAAHSVAEVRADDATTQTL
jgi:predicted ATP-grasp superfamily ATP-dependent carboligase